MLLCLVAPLILAFFFRDDVNKIFQTLYGDNLCGSFYTCMVVLVTLQNHKDSGKVRMRVVFPHEVPSLLSLTLRCM